MKIAYAFFSVTAEHGQDGRLWIAGADFDFLRSPSVPFFTPMCLVGRAYGDSSDDEGSVHTIRLDVTSPSGDRTAVDGAGIDFTVSGDSLRKPNVRFVLHFGMNFPRFGQYVFHIIIDGNEISTVPLEIQPAG